MERSKLKMAWNILYLLVNVFLIVVGISPIIYVYVAHEVPTGPSATTAQSLIFACILMALMITTLEGISGTAHAISRLIGGANPGWDKELN